MKENRILKGEGVAISDGEKREFAYETPGNSEIPHPILLHVPPFILKFFFSHFTGSTAKL